MLHYHISEVWRFKTWIRTNWQKYGVSCAFTKKSWIPYHVACKEARYVASDNRIRNYHRTLLIFFHPVCKSNISMLLDMRPLPLLLLLPFLYSLPRNSEPFDTCRHATVTARLQDDLADLFLGRAIVQRTFDVRRKFGRSVLIAQHRDVEE